jgi:dihydroneopterin aldolase
MGIIKLEHIKIYAYHGCLPEESKIGSDYKVDLEVKTDLRKSAITDQLADTVDYVFLQKIVSEEMAIRSNLLEHVAYRIITRIFAELPEVSRVKVCVAKQNPPIGGDVAHVSVELEEYRN